MRTGNSKSALDARAWRDLWSAACVNRMMISELCPPRLKPGCTLIDLHEAEHRTRRNTITMSCVRGCTDGPATE